MRIFALAALLLLAVVPASADDGLEVPAASGLPSGARNTLRNCARCSSSSRSVLTSTLAASARRCYEAIKADDFNRLFATAIARDFTLDDIVASNLFWSSPVGAKFMHMAYRKKWEMDPVSFPLRVEGPKQSMNFAEIRELFRFRESVDERIVNPLAYLDSEPMRSELAGFILEARMLCEEIR